ncbi:MAG: DNA alkylation repair protein [Candidatus Helarchaeota archaeon]
MVSTHSLSEIKKRTIEFFETIDFLEFKASNKEKLQLFLKQEYDTIPEKERIGKGEVFVAKSVSKILYALLKKKKTPKTTKATFEKHILSLIEMLEADSETLIFAIYLASQLALDNFDLIFEKIKKWAKDENWTIRECARAPLLSGLKKNRQKIFRLYKKWVNEEDPNLRRIVAETLRPLAVNKWLRDPNKNDEVLEILTELNHDESIYVRKSVGNNLKDLTKYMPDKILDLIEKWLKDKNKLNEKDQKALIWTIYQALRWLKERNPEYHPKIEKLVGRNYILYFDEKRNRNAIPEKENKKMKK